MRYILVIIAVLLLLQGFPAFAKNTDTNLRRFALVVGANDGGRERVKLRYANSDAQTMATVLKELGGVMNEDMVILLDPDRESLKNGFDLLKRKMRRAKKRHNRTEMFFYYSGHSNESGLLLYGRTVKYKRLKQMTDRLQADVHVMILDSCASGAITRLKGGKRKPSFLIDASSNLKGHAFLTSSSADEASQESDKIGGSFFTHYLASGLRGAADVTQDRRVTLNEAYQYAFYETLERTETTKSGAQHASYDIRLKGTGDLVMTEIRDTSAGLLLSEDFSGRLYIRDSAGKLIAELRKTEGKKVELGLESGYYRVTLDQKGELFKSEFTLEKGKRTELSKIDFKYIEGEYTVARGETNTKPVNPNVVSDDDPEIERTGYTNSQIINLFNNMAKQNHFPEVKRFKLQKSLKDTLNSTWFKQIVRLKPVKAVIVYKGGEGGFIVNYMKADGFVSFKNGRQNGIVDIKSWGGGAMVGGSSFCAVGLVMGLKDLDHFGGTYTGGVLSATAAESSSMRVLMRSLSESDGGSGFKAHDIYTIDTASGLSIGAGRSSMTIVPNW